MSTKDIVLQTSEETVRLVEEIFKDLIIDNPLYGDILINVKREETELIPTLAVTPDKTKGSDGVKMLINKLFFNTLVLEEKFAVIVHETQHIICNHFRRFSDQFKSQSEGYIANLATDCSINQFNPYKLPEPHVKVEDLEEMVGCKLERKRESEYYYNFLAEKVKENEKQMQKILDGQGGQGNGQSQGEGDEQENDSGDGEGLGKSLKEMLKEYAEKNNSDHEGSADEMDNMNPLQKAALDNIIRKALDKEKQRELRRQGCDKGNSIIGIVPDQNVKIHKSIWRNLINKSFGETPSAEDFEVVYGKPNRRNFFSPYGKKRLFEDSVCYVIIDTSASIDDDELALFVSHMNKAMKSENVTTHVIQCDWDVQDVKLNVRAIPKKKPFEVYGRGGTDLTKGLDKVIELEKGQKRKVDVITFTDGYTAWEEFPKMNQSIIYTKNHQKIENVKKSAVLDR